RAVQRPVRPRRPRPGLRRPVPGLTEHSRAPPRAPDKRVRRRATRETTPYSKLRHRRCRRPCPCTEPATVELCCLRKPRRTCWIGVLKSMEKTVGAFEIRRQLGRVLQDVAARGDRFVVER